MNSSIEIIPVDALPLVLPGDPLGPLISRALQHNKLTLEKDDILVIAQKIVSKSEDRYVDLNTVNPGAKARELASICDKDPRLVQSILNESDDVIRCAPGVIIVRHKLGLVLANAGIDHSNIGAGENSERVLLLPQDADASAIRLVQYMYETHAVVTPVIISDSLGRAWRLGTTGTCIGSAGIEVLRDERGKLDLFGQELQSTQVGTGDEIAAAASLLMGQASEGIPVVIVRGWVSRQDHGSARDLVRPIEQDLFR